MSGYVISVSVCWASTMLGVTSFSFLYLFIKEKLRCVNAQRWLNMHMCARTMTNPGAVWEQVRQSCQGLVYVFWPTLYINTVCDLVRVYLSLFRCYLGQFQCGNLGLIRSTPRGVCACVGAAGLTGICSWITAPANLIVWGGKKMLTGDHKEEEVLCAKTNCLTRQPVCFKAN